MVYYSHLLNRTVLQLVEIIGLQTSAMFPVNLDNASFVWLSVPVEYQCCLAKEAVSPLLYKKYYLLCTQKIKTINVFMEKVKTFV